MMGRSEDGVNVVVVIVTVVVVVFVVVVVVVEKARIRTSLLFLFLGGARSWQKNRIVPNKLPQGYCDIKCLPTMRRCSVVDSFLEGEGG